MVKRYDDDGNEIDFRVDEIFRRLQGASGQNRSREKLRRAPAGARRGQCDDKPRTRGAERMFTLGLQAEKIQRRPHIPMLEEHNVRQGLFRAWRVSRLPARRYQII